MFGHGSPNIELSEKRLHSFRPWQISLITAVVFALSTLHVGILSFWGRIP